MISHLVGRLPIGSRQLRAAGLATALLLVLQPVRGQGPAQPPDFDIRGAREQTLSTLGVALPQAQQQALQALRDEAGGPLDVKWSRLTSAPSRLSRTGAHLTLPSNAPAQAVANAFLGRYRLLWNLTPQDVQEMRFARELETEHNGVRHLTLQQRADGIDVFGGEIKINLDADGRILNVSGEPIPNLDQSVNSATPSISAEDAVFLAASSAGVDAPGPSSSRGLVYFPLALGNARLSWRVLFEDSESPNLYESIVDAVDGTVLWRKNLTSYDHFPTHGLVYTSDDPNPNTPKGTATGVVPRDDVAFHGGGFFPHDDPHFDWWAGNPRTTTTSNNVDAYADRDGDNVADPGSRPAPMAGEDFSFAVDLTMEPDTYQDAAVTNLFYWNNRLHDWLYRMGFTERAGNFQTDNFGLGGLGGDAVMAEAQDNRDGMEPSLCNANFNTPPDGMPPRMQMFQCDNTSPERDGDFDNVVIGHEYGHGVHSRLVPTSGNQAANEGWSDYFGLALVSEPGDAYDGAYGIANWLFAGNGDGIRSDPYSTDLTIYKRTYADIGDVASCQVKTCSSDDTETCTEDEDCSTMGDTCDDLACSFHEDCEPPNTTISQGPCRTGVHRTGEVWANALWNMRMNLVFKWGFATGDRTANRLVVDGMKLSPDDPTFLDGRDAILDADVATNGGVNQCLIWDAFAKMGMGVSALTTGVLDLNPFEAFDVAPGCAPVIQVNGGGDIGGVCDGDEGTAQLTIFNTGGGDLIVSSVERVSGSADISVDPMPATPVFISPDAHVDFTVRCEPSSPGLKTATIRISSNDSAMPTKDVVFTCTGGEPEINVAIANSGSFGAVCQDGHADLGLTLFNQGTCNLTISNVQIVDDAMGVFELPQDLDLPLVLSPDADFNLPVRFSPDMCFDEPKNAQVRITSDDANEMIVNVAIGGTSPCPNLIVDPADVTGLHAFPPTVVDAEGSLGCWSERIVVLRNNGSCPLEISSIMAAGVSGNPADFAVAAPTTFPILLPGGEETLNVRVRFTPQSDDDPLAPSEVLGQLTIASDDPDGAAMADLCGESVQQSGVRILVTDTSSGDPLPISNVDVITLSSKGKHTPSPINLRYTEVELSTANVCGNEVLYHVDQESLPSTETTGSGPKSSYTANAKEGNLQAGESFTLAQCEFRDFQLQLSDSSSGSCLLKAKGESCTSAGECCSGKCNGAAGAKTCK